MKIVCLKSIEKKLIQFLIPMAYMACTFNFSAAVYLNNSHYKNIGYNNMVLKLIACLMANPTMLGNFAFLFNCTLADGTIEWKFWLR